MDTTMEKQSLLGQKSRPDEPEVEGAEEEQNLSLYQLEQNARKAQRAYMRAWSRTMPGRWHKWVLVSTVILLLVFSVFWTYTIATATAEASDWRYPRRVPLEAHIMSKCPDATDCLHDLILPAMQKISHKVDFKLSFIGNATDHDGGVLCKHGQQECLGNLIEICAAHLYPDPMIYLGFTMCMSRQYQDIPTRELVEECALEHGVSMQGINDCAILEDGSLGVDMLQQSFERSARAGASKSCTVRLDGEVRCIRDDGEWSDCEGGSTSKDLVGDVERLWWPTSSR